MSEHRRRPSRGTAYRGRARQARRRRRRRAFAVAGLAAAATMVALVCVVGVVRRPSHAPAAGPEVFIAAPPLTEGPATVGVPEAPVLAEAFAAAEGRASAEAPSVESAAPLVPDPPDALKPENPAWDLRCEVYTDGRRVEDYVRDAAIRFSEDGGYTNLQGVVTFRGGNLRQNAAYGSAELANSDFKVLWKNHIGAIDSGYAEWTGVGWTGQPVLVRWPPKLRRAMNLKDAYRDRDDLVEAIYGTLDGNIYFLDAQTGEYTREPIALGFPIKGSVSVDPRGYPLLYVGQGISRANGVTGDIGWRVYSLLDQRELYFLDGHDKLCFRDHGAFDGACLLDAAADTLLQGGENGIFYTVKLNTVYDPDAPSVSVSPEVTAYRYRSAVSAELGIENSVAAYDHYAWFCDNSGLMTCLDLNTLQPVWLGNAGDDTDATIALEREGDGRLILYTVNQVDKQGEKGRCTIRRLDAMTGVADWTFAVTCESDGENGGGGFASPAIGQNAYSDRVYFNLCRTEGGGTLYCFNKADGQIVWSQSTGSPSWSSPVLVYRNDGTGVLVVANMNGRGVLRMYDPATGKKLGKVELEGKIEASPAVFDDLLVIGTRDRRIYGVRLV